MQQRPQQKLEHPPRPTVLSDARLLVDRIYGENAWGVIERASHQRMIGLNPKLLSEMSLDEVRIIVADLEKSKMVIFRD